MIAFPDGTVRYFTTFEAKRIQTFPDDFVVEGAWGEAMRQIGNAVPVLLARRLGEALMNALTEKERIAKTLKAQAARIAVAEPA